MLLSIRDKEKERLNELKRDFSQIQAKDRKAEMLYKMYEMVKHVNWALGHLNTREDSLHKMLRTNSHLPDIIKGYEKIPKQLKDEEGLLATIEH